MQDAIISAIENFNRGKYQSRFKDPVPLLKQLEIASFEINAYTTNLHPPYDLIFEKIFDLHKIRGLIF